MVSGHTQAVDSAPVKANASMQSVVLITPATSIDPIKKKRNGNEGPAYRFWFLHWLLL